MDELGEGERPVRNELAAPGDRDLEREIEREDRLDRSRSLPISRPRPVSRLDELPARRSRPGEGDLLASRS